MVRWGLAAMAVLALAGAARADDLADARAAVEQSDYFAARAKVDKALADGGANADELAELYKLKGIVEGALGNSAAATTAFGKWLALDPKAELPAGTSPKITRPFTAAQTQAAHREPVKVKTETTADPASVTLIVVSDPFMMIAKARVIVRVDGGAEQTLESAGEKKIKIDLPHGKRLDLRVQALDEHGNHVAELGTADVPIVIVGPGGEVAVHAVAKHEPAQPKAAPAPAHARPLYLKWWAWTGVAVVFAAGGTYFGFQARSEADQLNKLNADSQDHRFDEALALQSTASRDVTLFNVGMGVAGAFAVGATILYLTEPRAETRLTAMPVQGGGAVVVGGSF
jgi:tetratricopeptide (TPR) repeat protein